MSTIAQEFPPTFRNTSPVANGLSLTRDPLEFYTRLSREAGNFAHYALADGIVYFVNDPALVREVLVTSDGKFEKWTMNRSYRGMFRTGLLGSEGELHHGMRWAAQPAFQKTRLEQYAGKILEVAREQQANWREGEVDLSREMSLLTLEVVGRSLFSRSLREDADAIIYAARTQVRMSTSYGSSPVDDRDFNRAGETMMTIVRKIFDAARENPQGLLRDLFQAHAAGRSGFDENQIVEEINTFILAGHVTTAIALSAAFWLLAEDKIAAGQLEDELAKVSPERALQAEDLPRLRFAEMIFLETIRLYPPVWVLGRRAISEVEIGSWKLPVGSRLVIVPWLLHRNQTYFARPNEFRPERWRDNYRAELPKGVFIPFALGSRSCLGERFAVMEGTLVLASILQNWSFQRTAEANLDWQSQVVLWPRSGIRLKAKRRAPVW